MQIAHFKFQSFHPGSGPCSHSRRTDSRANAQTFYSKIHGNISYGSSVTTFVCTIAHLVRELFCNFEFRKSNTRTNSDGRIESGWIMVEAPHKVDDAIEINCPGFSQFI